MDLSITTQLLDYIKTHYEDVCRVIVSDNCIDFTSAQGKHTLSILEYNHNGTIKILQEHRVSIIHL